MKSIIKCSFLFLISCLVFSNLRAQESRNIIGFNVIPNIGSSLGNMEFSFEKFSYYNGGKNLFIPVIIVGYNSGNQINKKHYNSTFNLKTFYAKIGFEFNVANKEIKNKNRTFFQILLGYSSNQQISNVKISNHFFDEVNYKGYQNFNAYLFQMFLMNESILSEHFSISYGIGFSVANVFNRSNLTEPIACIGGYGYISRLLNYQYKYANIPLKLSLHYQF